MSAGGDAIKTFFNDRGWLIHSGIIDSSNEDNFYAYSGECVLWVFIDDGVLSVDEKSRLTSHHRILSGRFELSRPDCFDDLNQYLRKALDEY